MKIRSEVVIGLVIFFVVVFLAAAVPLWRVWQADLSGKASLARATQTRKIMVEQARAEVEAAKLRAEAISIVGKAAADFPEYREQEFMAAFGEALQSDKIEQIIYVPTEANIPVMEATRGQRGKSK